MYTWFTCDLHMIYIRFTLTIAMIYMWYIYICVSIYICVFYILFTYEICTIEHRSNLYRTSITIILKMYQTSTEFLLEITRGYLSIIKCKDPTHCIIRSNKHFIIRREHPTAQRSNTLHNKIQPTFSIYDVHQAISRCRLLREPYT